MACDLAQAIAHAEGFGQVGAIPTRANNPLDLVVGDRGLGTLGAENITVFPTAEDGWAAAETEMDLIRTRHSRWYTPSTSLAEMAARYAPGQPNWLVNVLDWLKKHGHPNAQTSTCLGEFL